MGARDRCCCERDCAIGDDDFNRSNRLLDGEWNIISGTPSIVDNHLELDVNEAVVFTKRTFEDSGALDIDILNIEPGVTVRFQVACASDGCHATDPSHGAGGQCKDCHDSAHDLTVE